MLDQLGEVLSTIGFSVAAIFGFTLGTAEPAYELLARIDDRVEIRQYPARLVAETRNPDHDSASGQAFSRLAGYIFGANQERRKMAMTTPVEIGRPVREESGAKSGAMTMRFFLPAELTLADLPQPDDAAVTLTQLPPETLAVYRFSGLSDQRNLAELAALTATLRSTVWEPNGPPSAYYYNPPWTLPFLRRNELVLPVQRRSG